MLSKSKDLNRIMSTPREISIGLLLAVIVVSVIGYAVMARKRTATLVRMENVRILRRDSLSLFELSVQDPDTHQWAEFSFNACPDHIVTEEAQAGRMFKLLKYMDYDWCQDVGPDNLGYILVRDENHNPIQYAKETR